MNISSLEMADEFKRWYDLMPQFRRQKIDAIKPAGAKRLSLGAGILLRRALEDIGIGDYEVEYGSNEKPYLKGRRDVFFNISHSGEMVIIGISDQEIGVDIEKTRTFNDALINYVFNDEDKLLAKELLTRSGPDEAFTELWTVKESIMKHSGKGIVLGPKSIKLSQKGGELLAFCDKYDCSKLRFSSFEVDGYMITVCSSMGDFAVTKV